MKKIFKWGAIIIVALIVLSIIGGSGDKDKNSTMQEAFDEGFSNAEQKIEQMDQLTKEQAMSVIQNYKITVDLEAPETPKGTTILEYYENRGKIPAITNIGWYVEEIEPGKYQVSYKQKIENLESNPRWEVSKDEIKALNGSAITITPEFGPQQKQMQGTDLEIQVHKSFSDLYKKYEKELFEQYELPTGGQIDEIEKRALTETASQFEITNEKVAEIFSRLESQKYNQ